MSVKCTMYMSLSAVYCSSVQFKCYSGECVSGTQCTGVDSCSDGSDEEGCARKYFMYTLRNQCTITGKDIREYGLLWDQKSLCRHCTHSVQVHVSPW